MKKKQKLQKENSDHAFQILHCQRGTKHAPPKRTILVSDSLADDLKLRKMTGVQTKEL